MKHARSTRQPRLHRFLRQRNLAVFLGVGVIASVGVTVRADDSPDFGTEVEPIFARHCIGCHSVDRQRGGFRLDSAASAFGEADSGYPPIVPGEIDESELLRRVTSDDEGERMPPEGDPLSNSEIAVLRRWIVAGATWPDSNSDIAISEGELKVTDEDRGFWAFRPLAEIEVPAVTFDGVRNPVDQLAFSNALAKRDTGLPSAVPLALQRRMYFDVIGLPPDESRVRAVESNPESFHADDLVEQLLESAHFGERWARHWLDVARYADSNGYENDLDRPYAYQYRDFVIRAFNEDLPFDDFVRWQIAGDEIASDNPMAVAATGFLAAGPLNRSAPVAPDEVLKKIRYDELDDIVATTSQAFLGLTLACARCHDHKFDPIPTRDYYQFVAAFASTVRRESDLRHAQRQLDLWVKQSKRQLLDERIDELDCTEDDRKWLRVGPMNPAESKKAFRKYGEAIKFTDDEWRSTLSDEDRVTLDRLEAAVLAPEAEQEERTQAPWMIEKALFVTDQGPDSVPMSVLQRGDVSMPGDPAPPGVLTVLQQSRDFKDYREGLSGQPSCESTLNRAAVASWLIDTEHGAGHLVARVIVNRIWHHYFGTGIVGTPNDFGAQGGRPTSPELLDWLAAELIRNQWRMKSIHRLILKSNTYRQCVDASSKGIDDIGKTGPFVRRAPRRLDSEATRDAILAASGRLNRKMFGPAIRPYVPTAAMATRSGDKWPEDVREQSEHFRRSLYIFVKRSIRFPMMEAFDAPDPTASCGRRVATTVPVQALTLMNDPSVRGAAHDFAASLCKQHPGKQSEKRVRSAFRRSLGRSPSKSEVQRALVFMEQAGSENGLVDLCHLLFLSNEFVYVE